MKPMAEDEHKHRVIIKRIKKVQNKHHGGSWKIAYADFVTAMMAFFLLMWLLSLLNKYQLEGIAEYFKKPLKEVFTKQDNIARTNTIKPDKLGPSTYKNTGLKDVANTSPEKNLGVLDKTQNPASVTQGNPQTNIIEVKDKSNAQGDEQQDKQKQQQQLEQMKQLKAELEAKLKNDPAASQFKNSLNFVVTSDGLKIILHDLENKPMFSQGKADFEKYAENILSWLTKQINSYPNRIMIIGHTDSIPYSNTAYYGNWELSVDRANAVRRLLVNNGLDDNKILRIVGGADTDTLFNHSSDDPAKRRIEIILLTDQAAKNIQTEQ